MVNLDNVRTGDTLVVEVPVYVYASGSIELKYADVRYRHDEPFGNIKVLEHKPKPIEEPTGLGAVVKVKGKVISNTYTVVRAPSGHTSWVMVGYNGVFLLWKDILKDYEILEVVSPGVDVTA